MPLGYVFSVLSVNQVKIFTTAMIGGVPELTGLHAFMRVGPVWTIAQTQPPYAL
jgi:hypothetical protein